MVPSTSTGPPTKAARLTSASSVKAPNQGRFCDLSRPNGAPTRLGVFARLPTSSPYVGNFHYAPSAGNRAYSFFEGQIVPNREKERLHKIKTNPLTGNFHSRPGHYSRLHGLHNFRKNATRGAAGGDNMRQIIARIKTTLMEPSSSATAEATAEDMSLRSRTSRDVVLEKDDGVTHRHRRSVARTGSERHSPLSACDATLAISMRSSRDEDRGARGRDYNKYWEEADTERGRFGSSVDDNALGTSYAQRSSSPNGWDGLDPLAAAVVAAGVSGHGKGEVHWGKHHHHHGQSSDEGMSEPLIGDATAKLRHLYFQRQLVLSGRFATESARSSPATAARRNGVGDGSFDRPKAAISRDDALTSRLSSPGAWERNNVETTGRAGPPVRSVKASHAGHGWESHTIKAQQKTEEYILGKEGLAPDMRQNVVLDKQLSEAYDVDVSDAGILGSGAYSTVFAAVHRSTGRQVAIKTMMKKYLFSDAEKASVGREIEIQQRLVNNHIIRLYEIYQSPEKLYLVMERAPCGSLEEFLFARGRLNELDAKRVVRQLLDGVAYLHKVGVVHCDLKPANVLLSNVDQGADAAAPITEGVHKMSDGKAVAKPRARSTPPASLQGVVVKICDFGHTRKVPDCRYYKFTGSIHKIPFHMFKHTGTEGFVAPEVLLQEPYGKAADMWSTGCILYNMLSGRMPWVPSRACLQRPLSTSGHTWGKISAEAKSLVEDLLHTDQTFRADVEQATHHPWFEGIHHCARMPTSAPGAKNLGLGAGASDVQSQESLGLNRRERDASSPQRTKALPALERARGAGGSALARVEHEKTLTALGLEASHRRPSIAEGFSKRSGPSRAPASSTTRLRARDLFVLA